MLNTAHDLRYVALQSLFARPGGSRDAGSAIAKHLVSLRERDRTSGWTLTKMALPTHHLALLVVGCQDNSTTTRSMSSSKTTVWQGLVPKSGYGGCGADVSVLALPMLRLKAGAMGTLRRLTGPRGAHLGFKCFPCSAEASQDCPI